MADQEANSGGNGAGDDSQPQVSILAQYVKDLSVENPSAPQVYSWQVQPGLDVQFNLNVENAGEGTHEALPVFLMVEAPRLLFPFARRVISDAVSSTGFPPLMLDPIDFASAYMAQMEAAQQQALSGTEQAPTEA